MSQIRGMAVRLNCRQSPGCGLPRLAVPLRHQGVRSTVWVKTQEPVLFLLVGGDIAANVNKISSQRR